MRLFNKPENMSSTLKCLLGSSLTGSDVSRRQSLGSSIEIAQEYSSNPYNFSESGALFSSSVDATGTLLAFGTRAGTVHVLNTQVNLDQPSSEIFTKRISNGPVKDIVFSDFHNAWFLSEWNGMVYQLSLSSLTTDIYIRTNDAFAVNALATDHHLLGWGRADGAVGLLDIRAKAIIFEKERPHALKGIRSCPVSAVAISCKEPYLATAGGLDGTVKVWDLRMSRTSCVTYERDEESGLKGQGIVSLSSHPLRGLVWVRRNGKVSTHNPRLVTPVQSFDHLSGVTAAGLSPDGENLALASTNTLAVCSLGDARKNSMVDTSNTTISKISWLPNYPQKFWTFCEHGRLSKWQLKFGPDTLQRRRNYCVIAQSAPSKRLRL